MSQPTFDFEPTSDPSLSADEPTPALEPPTLSVLELNSVRA